MYEQNSTKTNNKSIGAKKLSKNCHSLWIMNWILDSLNQEGFSNVQQMPITCLYSFERLTVGTGKSCHDSSNLSMCCVTSLLFFIFIF